MITDESWDLQERKIPREEGSWGQNLGDCPYSEKEGELSSKTARERAARRLHSYVNSTEWTAREAGVQERECDLKVKDLRAGKGTLTHPWGEVLERVGAPVSLRRERGKVTLIAYVFIKHLLFSRLFLTLGIQQYRQDTCSHEAYIPVVGRGR